MTKRQNNKKHKGIIILLIAISICFIGFLIGLFLSVFVGKQNITGMIVCCVGSAICLMIDCNIILGMFENQMGFGTKEKATKNIN